MSAPDFEFKAAAPPTFLQDLTDKIEAATRDQLDRCIIDLSAEYTPPVPLLSMRTSLYGKTEVPVFTRCALSAIVGLPKGRKSCLVSLLAVDFLQQHEDDTVLLIDTEQPEADAQRCARRVPTMLGLRPTDDLDGRLIALTLLSEPKKDRFSIIKQAVDMFEPTLIFLDGVADLVNDVNNCEDSAKLTDDLAGLAAKGGCHICSIIHKNPTGDSDKAKGHLGSFLQQKCETVMLVKKEGIDTSIVECIFSRHGDFDPATFYVDNNFVPHWSGAAVTGQKKSAHDDHIDRLIAILQAAPQCSLTHTALKRAFMEGAQRSESTFNQRLTAAVQIGKIAHNERTKLYYLPYTKTEPQQANMQLDTPPEAEPVPVSYDPTDNSMHDDFVDGISNL